MPPKHSLSRILPRTAALWIGSLALSSLGAPAAWASAVIVTAIAGESTVDGRVLEARDKIETDAVVELETGAIGSMLVSDNAVVQLCNSAALRFQRETRRGPSVIDLLKGEIKASTGERPAEEPLEIHTPAAIATLLGTAVHLTVDPATGDTTITSLEHRVRVASSDPEAGGSIVLSPGDQVTVPSGGAPGDVRKINPLALTRTSDCLDDMDFRLAALAGDRTHWEDYLLEFIPLVDIPTEDLIAVGAGPGGSGAAGAGQEQTGREENPMGICVPGINCVDFGLTPVTDPQPKTDAP